MEKAPSVKKTDLNKKHRIELITGQTGSSKYNKMIRNETTTLKHGRINSKFLSAASHGDLYFQAMKMLEMLPTKSSKRFESSKT